MENRPAPPSNDPHGESSHVSRGSRRISLGLLLGIQVVVRVQLYGRLANLRNVAAFARYIFYEVHDEARHEVSSFLPLVSGKNR
jgi:hypothetical protein